MGPAEQGSCTEMRDAWLRWGKDNGYLAPNDDLGVKNNGTIASCSARHISRPPEEDSMEKKFQYLAAIWRAETCYLSSSSAMTRHPAYQEIISMGPAVVPLLLREMAREPDHWWHALQTLTGANPLEPGDRGNTATVSVEKQEKA